ncbi:hypothetical protein Tco_0252326, partial [Tanacetum coccineum]
METKDTFSSSSYSEEQQMQQIQDKAKKSCMVFFSTTSFTPQASSNNDLKGTRTECGFKRAFAKLFRQDVQIFTGIMFLNMDQLEKQLDKDEFQELGSMDSFRYFLAYTQTDVQQFCDTLIRHMESVKKSIDERAPHKREYDNRVERQTQTKEGKVDTSKALDASLIDKKSSGTKSGEHDTNNRSRNDAHTDDADIRSIYNEEPMAEVPTTAKINAFVIGELHAEQPEFNNKESNEAKVKHDIDVIETINIELKYKVAKLLKKSETLKKHYKELYDTIKTTRAKTIEHTTSLIAQNAEFKAQLQEKGFAIATLKNELRKLKGNNVNTKFVKSSILGKPVLQPHRNQSVVRQPTKFKYERPRISKSRFASQVDMNNDLSKPVTTHYLPKERESAIVKPHHLIASSESRNNLKNMPRFSSNDIVYNHYLDEARKKTQEKGRNSEPSMMPSARLESTANGSKPKPRINNQKSRSWHASKSSTSINVQEEQTLDLNA